MPDLPVPENETLAEIARALDEASMVATLMDPEFRLVWLSHEFRAMFGEPGQHEAAVLFADIGESSVLARRLHCI